MSQEDTVAIFRAHKTRNYTVMSNHHLRNDELSLKAIGLLSKMLSLPDDWDYNLRGLASLVKDGETSVRSGLNELEEAGYLERRKERVNGRFVTIWDIHEVPVTSDEWREQPAQEAQMEIPCFDDEGAVEAGQREEPEAEDRPKAKPKVARKPSARGRHALTETVTKDAVEYLNERTGRHFRPNISKTQGLVSARLKEGFTLSDFRQVIDKKVSDWLRDPKMSQYLRPETLFGTKFEGYLQEGGGHAMPDYSAYD